MASFKSIKDYEITGHGDHVVIDKLTWSHNIHLPYDILAEIVNHLVEENYIEFTSKLGTWSKGEDNS